jgi:glycosyltransferase involved in cell wall biosynthesis
MSISALMSVYNEEERIETAMKNLQWCDEIIILDKNSTDNTRAIAEKYGAKVFLWNNTEYDSSEIPFLFGKSTSEWILTWTASDIIHPDLALKIKELTSNNEFEYDIISVPFYTYILGIDSKRSPWHTELKPYVLRKSALKLNNDGVHDAIQFNSNRFYKLKKSDKHCIYHLTHVSTDVMMERHTRYWRAEARYFDDKNLKIPLRRVVAEIINVTLIRKTFLMGRDGIMLIFAFLSYYMMSYVYKWEKKYGNAYEAYDKIRKEILNEWEKKQ